MSDQASHVAELLLEDALDEIFHGGPSPELADRILRAASGDEVTVAEAAPAQDATPAPALSKPEAQPTPLRRLPSGKAQGRRWVKFAMEGIVAAGIAAVLILVLMPDSNPNTEPNPSQHHRVELPAGVAATDDAQYTPAALGGGPDGLQVDGGWYVLHDGAPSLVNGGHSVEDVEGTVLVKVGDIPQEEEVTAMAPWLSKHQIEEKDMSARKWIKVGALAVCVMAGSAWLDNQYVSAQDTDRKADVERPAAKLKQLERELQDLKNKLQRARNMDDGRDKRRKIARIENAIKEKERQIAAAKERIRNAKGDDRKDSDRKDSDRGDRKDGDRGDRKNGDNADRDRKAREDAAAAKARREAAERKRKAEQDRKDRADEEARKKRAEEKRRRDAARKRENDRKDGGNDRRS